MSMALKDDVVGERAGTASRGAMAHEFDLFVVHAAADGEFVHGFLLPALNLPASRVLLVDRLTPGPPIVAEILAWRVAQPVHGRGAVSGVPR